MPDNAVDYTATTENVQVTSGSTASKQEDVENNEGSKLDRHDRTKSYWWNPTMDSLSLEKQFVKTNAPLVRATIRETLLLLAIFFLCWAVYFFSLSSSGLFPSSDWLAGAVWSLVLTLFYSVVYFLPAKYFITDRSIFTQNMTLSVIILLPLVLTTLTSAYYVINVLTIVGTYLLFAQVVLCIYLFLPVNTVLALSIGVAMSIIYEILLASGSLKGNWNSASDIATRIVFHLLLHMLGWCITVRIRNLHCDIFWKVCGVVRSAQAMSRETDFKNMMIKSVMPTETANKIFNTEDNKAHQRPVDIPDDGKLFRSFIMQQMDNVSILYADIVGFTKMSANKNAAELVGLLNDLFGRFDELCEITGCEKISTLGDCYYCVAGCPQPRPDHAICCVEMGRGMIVAIKEFCIANNTSVNMRVGVHTGRVMCGIIGTKRYKFDVFSNDVSLANGMEQWGVPGRIHITKETLNCLQDQYEVEDSKLEERSEEFLDRVGGKTYFIVAPSATNQKAAAATGDGAAAGGGSDVTPAPMTSLNDGGGDKAASNGTSEHPPAAESPKKPTDDESDNQPQDTADEHHDTTVPLLSNEQQPNEADELPAAVVLTTSTTSPTTNNNVAADDDKGARYSNASTCTNGVSNNYKKSSNNVSPTNPTDTKQQQDQLMEYLGKPAGEQSQDEDQKLLDTIVNEDLFAESYRLKINQWTMFFTEPSFERSYLSSSNNIGEEDANPARSKSSRFIQDSVSSFVFSIGIFVLSYLQLNSDSEGKKPVWISVLVIGNLLMTVLIFMMFSLRYVPSSSSNSGRGCLNAVTFWSFPSRQLLASLFVIISLGLVASFVNCSTMCGSLMLLAGLILMHSCLFSQLNFWVRLGLNVVVAVIFISIYYARSNDCGLLTLASGVCDLKSTKYEFIVDFILLLLFVTNIGRCYELRNRLLFQCQHQIRENDVYMRKEKKRVEALLENFIPPHVRRDMKDQNVYSKTHHKVGVIFGSIVNFNELYDEDYAGGMEFIRILSELISDVDDLLDLPEYNHITKIKTIGTTMMLASGLNIDNADSKKEERNHLKQLMDFCISMQNAVDSFNKDMMNFNLVLRIGFNHGEVTAGVIGTTKRLYDIWGDTVNTASRMDSTGVPGRIQVSEESKKVLENDYNFKHIGEKFVKGKGRMETYLLVRDDEESRVIIPNPRADYEPF